MPNREIKNLMPRRYWTTKPDGSRTWRYFSLYKRPERSHEVTLGMLGDVTDNKYGLSIKEYERATFDLLTVYLPDLVSYCNANDIKLEARYGYTWAGYLKIWFYASSTRQRLTKLLTQFDDEYLSDRFCMISRTNPKNLRCVYLDEYSNLYNVIFPHSLQVTGPNRISASTTIAEVATAPWCPANLGWKTNVYLFHSKEDRMTAAMLLA
jgi:hypothetical protein